VKPTAALNLSHLTAAERDEVGAQLKADVAADPAFATDTYFGGKTLYRSAMLLTIADELGDAAAKRTLLRRLTTALDRWTQPGGCRSRGEQCFVYDPKLHTVVGLKHSFGSEQANDHHYHYGYFLYAAGVAAKYAPDAAKRWAPVLNLLAADLASRGGATFPTSRVYDPYFSHSWASGFAPFADGNNQESTSEAITAWTGLSLWAAASKQRPLAAEAAWLLSGETASALRYWLNPDLRGPAFAGFDHDMVSLTWSGKRDFATWFSAEPSAVVGIQLIPMSPASTYLRSDAAGGAAQIRRLARAASANGVDTALGDYVLMYRSLAGGSDATGALRAARSLPDKAIDNGNSRTYLLAYILANGVH
jgi:endoglucanase Acf2